MQACVQLFSIIRTNRKPVNGRKLLYNRPMPEEKYLISASRRCDIPAFANDWFLDCLEKGDCEVANPFNPRQISHVSLRPANVAAFIFWTRNPEPFKESIQQLIRLNIDFGFFMTINGYGQELEPFCPAPVQAITALRRLADQIGPQRLIWRYDPIIISEKFSFTWHIENFARLAEQLSPLVYGCKISLLDFYRKTISGLKPVKQTFMRDPEKQEGFLPFLQQLKKIDELNSLALSCCCENDPAFAEAKIPNSGCIDQNWVEQITGNEFVKARHKGQRKYCNCLYSRDIGKYDLCRHGCRYCYACTPRQTV